MAVDTGRVADRRFEAWAEGRTGYPIVDAGMRQLKEEAWMHNRVRMIVASFLVKDLHLDWIRGADLFMDRLQDGDLASNTHGWQWVAGTGTDPTPWFRIFNPTSQGKRLDPEGDYVRRWVPELRHVPGAAVHEPWKLQGGKLRYPPPIVDHEDERREALARYARIREHTTERQPGRSARRSTT
jgi:deoxyribodipyrimidine photo-lyase